MKKTPLVALLACALCAAAGPYVGADYQFTVPFYQGTLFLTEPQHFSAGDLHAGWRQGAVAAEAGYFLGGGSAGDTHMTMSGPTLDAFAFAPFFSSGAEIFATAGMTDFHLSDQVVTYVANGAATTRTETPVYSGTALSWRAGGGMQWQLSDAISARALLRYEDYRFGNRMNGAVALSVGFNIDLGAQ